MSVNSVKDGNGGWNRENSVRYLHVFPDYGRGGAELRVTRTINAMGPNQGHAIISINGNRTTESLLDADCSVKVVAGPPKKGRLRYPIDLWQFIRQHNPSVLITYNWGATDAIIGAQLARFFPVIHNECGMSADIDGKGFRRKLARRLLLPRCYRVVVTAHSFYEKVTQEYGVPTDKVAFIKTGVDTERFSPGTNAELRDQIVPNGADEVVFGYIGSLRPSKNIPMLLRAYADAKPPNSRLAIFGDGPEREGLQKLAAELKISKEVYFHGYSQNPELAFRAIDVNVTASKSEAASNSLLEAMATSLPVLTTDIADNARMLSVDNRAFVYSYDDHSGFSAGIKEMAMGSELRNRLGKINRERVCQEYPINRMYEEYANLWRTAADLSKAANRWR